MQMSRVEVSYGEHGDELVVWFASPAREHYSEKTDSGIILKKDAEGHVVGIQHRTYFALRRPGAELAPSSGVSLGRTEPDSP